MKISISFRSIRRQLVIGFAAVFLVGCKVVMSTTNGGGIVSASGSLDCVRGSCVYEVTEKTTDTFTAVPIDGYRFVRWKGLCKKSPTEICEASIGPLPEEYRQYEGEIELRAIFEPVTKERNWYLDRDGDHYGSASSAIFQAARPLGYVNNSRDCNDRSASVHPGAKEIADGRDNNCNGKFDERTAKSSTESKKEGGLVLGSQEEQKRSYFRDADGDGFGWDMDSTQATSAPNGYVRANGDCDDSRADIFPGAREEPDSLDNDCDMLIDEDFTLSRFFRDADGDGYGWDMDSTQSVSAPDGYVLVSGDCNDSRADIFPGAREEPDSLDNDCDLLIDEDFTLSRYFRDVDGDGYGSSSDSVESMSPLDGYVRDSGDCDDNNAAISPSAIERFDSVDNDCDGLVDENFDYQPGCS